jgi:hypothetical protein
MSLIKKNPIWLSIIGVVAALGLMMIDSPRASMYMILLGLSAAGLFLQLIFYVMKKLNPAPVPDSAIREMMKACDTHNSDDDWILIQFHPKISLAQARAKVGSATYSEEDRLQGFMTKFQMVAAMEPRIAIFYAPNKGILIANPVALKAMKRKYGPWMLDTWYSMDGALAREGFSTRDLDSPQSVALR